jgi:hypothetical protein
LVCVDASLDGIVQAEVEKGTMSMEAEFGDYQILVQTEEVIHMLDREGCLMPQVSMLAQHADPPREVRECRTVDDLPMKGMDLAP